jgi:hypothetical protein
MGLKFRTGFFYLITDDYNYGDNDYQFINVRASRCARSCKTMDFSTTGLHMLVINITSSKTS